MKRWLGALTLVLLACAGVVALHGRSDALLNDTDTQVMLARLAERHNPWSWFVTDWPLQNHFYRPVTALSFELDRHLWQTASGFGLSSSIYCALCILALFWLAREISDKPVFSASVALLFALWHSPYFIDWSPIAILLSIGLLIAGFVRHKWKATHYLPAVLAVSFMAVELGGIHLREAPDGFYRAVLLWLPGRTATLMTLFGLISLAAYVRFERTGAPRTPIQPSPTDPPTTRTSPQAEGLSRHFWIWLPVSLIAAALCLGSYEQGAMLPFIVLLAGGLMRSRGYAVRWSSHIPYWILLVVLMAVRDQVLPPGISAYQQQQMRHGFNALASAANYTLPVASWAPGWWSALSLGAAILTTGFFYVFFWNLAGNVVLYRAAFIKSSLAGFAWLSSVAVFLPMAFLKPFAHYHYWPMAMRSLFVVALFGPLWQLVIAAVSPRAIRAPARLVPAPGSLPHP